jgi:hypothetical protein
MHAGIEKNWTGAVMFGGKFRTLAALGALAIGLSACASPGDLQRMYTYRGGPDPAMPASHVDSVVLDQALVLRYIEDNAPDLRPGQGADHWHDVAMWGFNVGRQDCEIYMNVLFKLNREKQRNGSVITAFSTAATAVVGVAGSSPSTTLSILSASFGLLSALNDAYFTTYLFSQVPGLVAKKVSELQETYVDSFRPNAEKPILDIQSAADAYYAIRGYYQICLPETIEGTFLQQVAGGTPASVKPQPKADGAVGAPSAAAAAKFGVRPVARGPSPARINTMQ